MFTNLQITQLKTHYPNPFKIRYGISQLTAHTPYLTIESLGKNYGKLSCTQLFYNTLFRNGVKDRYTLFHFIYKFGSNILIYLANIFFFMLICGTHHGIYKGSVICHENKTGRILIKAPRIGDIALITKEIYYIIPVMTVRCANDTLRLI